MLTYRICTHRFSPNETVEISVWVGWFIVYRPSKVLHRMMLQLFDRGWVYWVSSGTVNF